MESASVAVGQPAEHEHHGPPPANQSSRVEAQFLGMLLFIISEIMLFGAFFTAYFFLRVVNHDLWPAHGQEIPLGIAAINSLILLSTLRGGPGRGGTGGRQPAGPFPRPDHGRHAGPAVPGPLPRREG